MEDKVKISDIASRLLIHYEEVEKKGNPSEIEEYIIKELKKEGCNEISKKKAKYEFSVSV